MSTHPSLTRADLFAFWNELSAYPAEQVEPMLAHFYRTTLPPGPTTGSGPCSCT